ncbi:glutamate racemase [Burkholderia ubonensis]|uniref:glutamate racemase n=1 Tax=Burkholderia ubonensis TaxID=101571 RepID=UPI000B041860|nr:aspartate/glutamate racemase family protein [Burkholderia ubonensis]
MIGVFDFGSGGLTVMRAFESALPDQTFVYLGDHGNAPYGNPESSDIYDLTQLALARLFRYGCTLIVVACNTAVATSLRKLQQEWLPKSYPDRKILGVIAPTVEEIIGEPGSSTGSGMQTHPVFSGKKIAVFATPHTVQSDIFPMEVYRRNPSIEVYQQACPGLALLIEQAAPEDILRREIRKNINNLLDSIPTIPDACILGCTHYPIVEHIWQSELPETMRIISQPNACARSLVEFLKKNPQFSDTRVGNNRFFTTGDISEVSDRASLFYTMKADFRNIDEYLGDFTSSQ